MSSYRVHVLYNGLPNPTKKLVFVSGLPMHKLPCRHYCFQKCQDRILGENTAGGTLVAHHVQPLTLGFPTHLKPWLTPIATKCITGRHNCIISSSRNCNDVLLRQVTLIACFPLLTFISETTTA